MVALVALAAFAIRKAAAEPELYAVADRFTPTDNLQVQATTSVKLTYGADGKWKASASNTLDDNLKFYVVGQNNPKDGKLSGTSSSSGSGYTTANKNLPKSGTYYVFEPSKAGTLKVGICLANDKSFYVTDGEGNCMSDKVTLTSKDGSSVSYQTAEGKVEYSVAAKLYGFAEFDVEAGGTYYVFCAGSKLSFYGFYFTEATASEPTKYNVSVATGIENGSVTVDKQSAAEGETVTITATPDNNYEVDAVSVDVPGTAVDGSGNTYTFTMPPSDVTVSATFKSTSTGGGDEPYYEKVTSTDNVTDGTYLIVYEEGGLALNGGLTDKIDAVGNSITVTISDATIESNETTDAASFTYDATNKTLKGAGGLYMGQTSDANGLQSDAVTTYVNTISFNEDETVNIVSGGAYLRYNAASDQKRFRYFKSKSYTSQKPIALYKRIGGAAPVETRIATTITLGEYATTAEVGAEYALPTATVTGVDGAPVENATVTWSSSDTEVAEIAATYAGLNLKKAGKATITATYEGDNNYKGSTASFELTVTAAPYTSIAAMLADITSTQTTVAYKFENLLVTYVNGSNTYVHDGTNGFLFYGSNLGLVAGQKITGTVTGQLYTYNGLPEMSVSANGISVTVASENNEVTWTSIAPADLQNNINVPVTIENAVFVEAGNGKKLNFKVGEKDLVVYNNWSIDDKALEADKAYNLTGIGSVYANSETTTYQLYLVSFEEAVLTSNTIWSSEDAVYATDISISAERFADATVGDKLHIEVLNTSTESIYNSCVKILNSDGKQLEDGVNVGLEPDGTIVSFVLTGDILTQLKANGLKLGGYGYYSKQIELETTETTGSKKSIWVGRQETGNIEISSFHFANANDFAGVKKGDIIRVTLDATEWIEGSGWVNLQYKKVYDWIDTQNTDLVQITNTWNGEPVDILINSDELAAELNDAVNNHGAVVQLGESTVATQVELIIKEPMKGDANLDGEVTVTDAEMAVSFALETETPTAEQLKATDLNESGDVTVSDAVGIVNIALEISDEPVAGARAFEAGSNMLTQDGLALNLQNTTSFVAFQMDVTLDNGAVLNGVQLAERAQGLKATYNKVGENTWRIVAFSVAKNVITGSEGNLLTLDVTGNQSATISHIEFSDSAANAYELALSSNTTGINTVGNAQQSIDNAYDLSGRRINGNTKGLRIVNGKKVVIK